MAILKIVEWPAKILETQSDVVSEFDEDLRKFVADMHQTMDAANGIGLAANQVGVAKRVITICIPWTGNRYEAQEETKKEWHDKRYTFINPVILKKSGKISWQEGCLSFPEVYEFVDRAAEVSVRSFDENGQEFEVQADGLFAVCIQHEIDHIDGRVFIDRMSRIKAEIIRKKIQRKGYLAGKGERK